MAKILGLDLGTSSLGWAILDEAVLANAPSGIEAPSVIKSGVVIFQEGMDRDKSDSLNSRAAVRRVARAARRLIFRRKLRKIQLLKKLAEWKMCPISQESIASWANGNYPINDTAFCQWLKSTPEKNPYADRKRAAEGKVDLFILGRALYHIAQRRGFKSSRKEQLAELGTDEENNSKKSKKQTELGVVKGAIAELTKEKGTRTLGQYFYDLYQENKKIRGRYTGRIEHYQDEFEKIVAIQKLPREQADQLRDIIFFQRPLRSQRHLVGYCELEKHQKKYRRAIESHPLYEAFSVWNFVNNMCVGDERRHLSEEERKIAVDYLTRRSFCYASDVLKHIRKSLEKVHEKNNVTFPDKMSHRDDAVAPVMSTTAQFKKLDLPNEEWDVAFHALIDFDDIDKLRAWAKKRYNWNDEQINTFLRTNPSEDRGRYSLHAIKKILPWLERGFTLRKATFFANLHEIIPNFEEVKEKVIDGLLSEEEDYRREKDEQTNSKIFKKVLPLESGYWKNYLVKNWGVKDETYKKLYISESGYNPKKDDGKLAPVDLGSYRNPLVCRSLSILRRLVNSLRHDNLIDEETHIMLKWHIALIRRMNAARLKSGKKIIKKPAQMQETHFKKFLIEIILTSKSMMI